MNEDQKYDRITDETLIRLMREGDAEIMDYLLNKYKNLVRKKAHTMFLIGGDQDDLIQEGMIGLYKSIRDYSEERDASFFRFAELCINRQLYSAITASNRKKHTPLNSYISLDSAESEEDGTGKNPGAQVQLIYFKNPEEIMLDKERVSVVKSIIERSMSEFEQKVLHMYLSGMSYTEIAKRLDKKPKSIDNALQRIRTKLSSVK